MIVVACAALVALCAVASVGAALVRALIRQQARERGLLLDQIMHLSGRTWTPPPADRFEPRQDEPGPVLFASPEQMTADDLDPVI